jgi:hypothetical protein
MSFLFKIEGKKVYPNTETLLVSPFKEIWERDKSLDKEKAIQEFAYIEFSTSMLKSNPYREYTEDRKDEILKKDIIKNPKYKPDPLVVQGITKLKEFQTEGSLTYTYWLANKRAIEKVITFFNDFDINERNFKTGLPIYKPKDVTSSLADAEKSLNTINNLKSKVDEELYEKSKNKSDKEISVFMQ